MSERAKGSTSVSLEFRLTDAATGLAKTGLDVTTLKLQFHRPGEAPSTATSLTLLASQTAAYSAYGAREVDATYSPGVCRVDTPNAAYAPGADEVVLTVSGPGIQAVPRLIDLTNFDSRNGNSGGLANLSVATSALAGASTLGTVATAVAALPSASANAAAVVTSMASAPVGSVANLTGIALSGGTVSASPSPTSTTFTATGSLNATAGGYTTAPMSVYWQTGANAGFKYPITVHAVSGSNHAFTVGSAMANTPAATDTFVIG